MIVRRIFQSNSIQREIIGRIYDEVRRRPLYLVHKLHQATLAAKPQVIPEATVRVQVSAPELAPVPIEDTVVVGQKAAA